ncbi:MAG TPA: carboxylesterase family protein [Allosphingosinicella sp.]|nr:carboxylesterase family protein [Allosphingosinicella sp.]
MSEPVVQTQYGPVRGRTEDGVSRFFGIPYAAAPVGAHRFRAPAPHPGWREVRDASALGPNAPHAIKPFPGLDVEPIVGSGWRKGDEYLNVNIWAPERAADDPLRPVMVWIHGGGFVIGSNYAAIQDGTAFAHSGIVLVAINYRMGVDGFLPIPGVPTNLGLRDMLFALEWVRENAASFGGDPDNVTVFGESAGAMAIADLIASPLAEGLFAKAIVESGHGSMVRDLDVAQRLVKKMAKLLGVPATEQGFRSTSFEQCVAAVEKVSLPTARINLRDANGHDAVYGISRFIPVWGDDVLPVKPVDALHRGAGGTVDLLIGTNAQEMNLYLVPTGIRDKIGSLLATFALSRSQPGARKVLKAYGLGRDGKKPGQALTDAMNDLVFRWPARVYAEAHKGRTHFYELDWGSDAYGGQLGASHGMELPFVFDTLASVTGPTGLAGLNPPQHLADRVHRIWAEFATHGHLPWQEYDAATRQVYQLGRGETMFEPVMPAARFLP